MVKIKFRVFVTKYCNGTSWPCDDKKKACKIKHEFPTHRYLFHQVEGDTVSDANPNIFASQEMRQESHQYVVSMLEAENKRDKDKKKQQRPVWQYDIEVA